MVADTGLWLGGRSVLLSPHAFGRFDEIDGKALVVNLTRAQIENSPPIDQHKPVSRQYEIDYYRYYGWPGYWAGGEMWGMGAYPVLTSPPVDLEALQEQHRHDDKHLRSAKEITGYQVHAADGPIGELGELAVDDRNWAIHALVVATGHWFSGKEMEISTKEVTRVSYEDSKIFIRPAKARSPLSRNPL